MTTPIARSRAAAVVALAGVAAVAALLLAGPAWSQTPASVRVEPNTGAPGSSFRITMNNYRPCAPDNANCIIIDFIQGATTTRIGTADSKGAASFSGEVRVPPTAVPGPGAVRAYNTVDDARTDFTVSGAPVTTTATSSTTSTSSTSTTRPTTTSTSSTSSTSTTVASTTTAVPITPKKTSSRSDVPRYIAVALVVLAAAATAAVDTRLRRLRG